VAEAAGFHLQANFSRPGAGDGPFNNFDGAVGGRDLCNAHSWEMLRATITTQKI
jgi:hypothetical protein